MQLDERDSIAPPETTVMLEGLAAQRSLALFVAGWLSFSFPLLGLWDADVSVFGLPLFPVALFIGWGLLIGAIAWVAETDPPDEAEAAPRRAEGAQSTRDHASAG